MVHDRADSIFLLERKKVLDIVRKHPGLTVEFITSKLAKDAFQHRRMVPGVRRHLLDLEEAKKVFKDGAYLWWPK